MNDDHWTKFSGIDWAAKIHAASVIDPDAQTHRITIEHSRDGFDRLVRWLARFGDPADLPVAIERPDGRLVDRLVEAGHPVVPVKTNAIKAWREAEVISGAKSDAGDADVIADYLRIRHRRLQIFNPLSDATRALRTVVRTRDDLVDQRVAAGNQLSALLDAFWPGANDGLRQDHLADRLGVPDPLPHPDVGLPVGAQAHGRILHQARLLRATPPR